MGAPTAVLMDEINQIYWWHTIDLGNGMTTPGRDDSPTKLAQIKLPESLKGLSVLDIGGVGRLLLLRVRTSRRQTRRGTRQSGLGLAGDRQERFRTRSQGTSARKSKTSSWKSSTSARSELVSSTWFSSSGSYITCVIRFSPWNGSRVSWGSN